MDFQSHRAYVDVCLDYALSYSQRTLGIAFTRTVMRITTHPENAQFLGRKPVRIQMGPGDVLSTPTDIEHGLYFFFGQITREWPRSSFTAYYEKIRQDMTASYAPFRSFSENSFQDSMRLRVYQDSMNIIAGRTLDGATDRSYSKKCRKALRLLRNELKPAL